MNLSDVRGSLIVISHSQILQMLEFIAIEALDEGFIFKAESFEFSAGGAFAFDGIISIPLQPNTFLFQLLRSRNVFLIMFMNVINFNYVIF